MKAIVQNGYGSVDTLSLREVKNPLLKEKEVLVRMRAVGINAGDLFSLQGKPWMVRFIVGFPHPRDYILGWDVAGIVEAVGREVTRFQPGDEVYGTCSHTLAEYVCAPEDVLALKPSNLSFEEAAAVPTAALTALQGLRDVGKLQAGQKVLINGASGGVGTFAVQIAKAFGAQVSGVCSTRNLEMVLSLGAEYVIDYRVEDFTRASEVYDLILDNVANHSFANLRKVLSPQGLIVPNSGHGGMAYVIKAFMLAPFQKQLAGMYMANPNSDDMQMLKEFIEDGKIKPIIDRVFSFKETKKAFRYLDEEHARGKIVISIMA